jgi:hypothetical protein
MPTEVTISLVGLRVKQQEGERKILTGDQLRQRQMPSPSVLEQRTSSLRRMFLSCCSGRTYAYACPWAMAVLVKIRNGLNGTKAHETCRWSPRLRGCIILAHLQRHQPPPSLL